MTIFTLVFDEWSYSGYGRMRKRLVLLGFAFLEPVGYSQATTVWRLRGIVKYMPGRGDWGAMTRAGFAGDSAGEEVQS